MKERAMNTYEDLKGHRFGRLVVLEEHPERSSKGKIQWICQCDCGKKIARVATTLKEGLTRSCGCLRREATIARATTHGLTNSSEYVIWCNMKDRCYRENNPAFPDYGGRGLIVCDGWRDSFETFLQDMGKRPSKKRSIDRIDNDLGYVCGKCPQCLENGWPSNCHWATKLQQANNCRSNLVIEHGGVSMTVAEWARSLGMNPMTIYARYARGIRGDKLFAPKKEAALLEYNGESKTVKEWAKSLGVSEKSLYHRLERGWTVEQAITGVSPSGRRHSTSA
jgi:hypothetical protein